MRLIRGPRAATLGLLVATLVSAVGASPGCSTRYILLQSEVERARAEHRAGRPDTPIHALEGTVPVDLKAVAVSRGKAFYSGPVAEVDPTIDVGVYDRRKAFGITGGALVGGGGFVVALMTPAMLDEGTQEGALIVPLAIALVHVVVGLGFVVAAFQSSGPEAE